VSKDDEVLPYFLQMAANGALALDHGLPALPEEFNRSTVLPLACWQTPSFALVIFLGYMSPDSETGLHPEVWQCEYERVDDEWRRSSNFSGSAGWFGAEGPPGTSDGMEGNAVMAGGWLKNPMASDRVEVVVWGWQAPDVDQVSLVQGDERAIREERGHYGTWVIGSERGDPWKVEAHGRSGKLLGSYRHHGPG